jgi:transcriptional regulator with XRE-family HTH domain
VADQYTFFDHVGVKTPLRKQFGQRLRKIRLAVGWSQEALADRCGFARSYMSRLERGEGNPSLDAIEVLADALAVAVPALFEPLTPADCPEKSVKVPFAADGTWFHPALTRPRTSRYLVGAKGNEQQFDRFEDALAYLREMQVAYWRRPNSSGNWSIVKAVRWDVLPEATLAQSVA